MRRSHRHRLWNSKDREDEEREAPEEMTSPPPSLLITQDNISGDSGERAEHDTMNAVTAVIGIRALPGHNKCVYVCEIFNMVELLF